MPFLVGDSGGFHKARQPEEADHPHHHKSQRSLHGVLRKSMHKAIRGRGTSLLKSVNFSEGIRVLHRHPVERLHGGSCPPLTIFNNGL